MPLHGADRITLWRALGGNPEAAVRVALLEQDVDSVRIALGDFEGARREVLAEVDRSSNRLAALSIKTHAYDRMFHHAKVFVCSVRRFGRMLEAMNAHRSDYPRAVGHAIATAWRKHRAFLHGYVDPRNAIEHIDGEVNGSNRRFINLIGDHLEVVDGCKVGIGQTALDVVTRAFRDIEVQAERFEDATNPFGVQRRFLQLLWARRNRVR